MCKAYAEFKDIEFEPWDPMGTTEPVPWNELVFWNSIRERAMLRDGHVCTTEGCNAIAMEVHHIVPRWAGGHSHPRNLRSLCSRCHLEVHQAMGGFNPPSVERDIVAGVQERLEVD